MNTSRRHLLISFGIFGWHLLVGWPKNVTAGVPLWSWRLFSVGPLSFEVGLSVDLGITGSFLELAGGIIGGILSFFSDSDIVGYYDAYAEPKRRIPPPPDPIIVTIPSNERMNGDQIRIRLYRIVDGTFIHLPKKGRLRIKKDGVMEFEKSGFEGYATLSYTQQLTVFKPDGKLVLAVTRQNDQALFLCHDSQDGLKAIEALTGAQPSIPET